MIDYTTFLQKVQLISALTGKIIDEGRIVRSMPKLILYIVFSLAVTLGANLILYERQATPQNSGKATLPIYNQKFPA